MLSIEQAECFSAEPLWALRFLRLLFLLRSCVRCTPVQPQNVFDVTHPSSRAERALIYGKCLYISAKHRYFEAVHATHTQNCTIESRSVTIT